MSLILVGKFLKDNKKAIMIIIGLIVVAFVIKYVLKKIKDSKKGDAPYITGGGTIPENWSPEGLSGRFESAFIGISDDVDEKNVILKEIYELNDNQLVALSNHWNKNYSSKTNWFVEYGGLYDVVNGEWGAIYFGDEVNYTPLVKGSLTRLGLTSANI